MSHSDSGKLLDLWKEGDQQAATEIFERYVSRLVGLARNRLSSRMAKRIDPEDVVQSAYRSFFRHARDDRYTVSRSGDLWSLLAAITVKKVHGQVERHTAQKRAIDREEAEPDEMSIYGVHADAVSREPSPIEALAVVEELEAVMRELSVDHRRILELRLQEHTIEEVAAEVECSERTVRRVLDRVRDRLREQAEATKTS